jgi:hypothetical protein
MQADLAYYRRRAAEETAAAHSAVHQGARDAHIELAGRYEIRIAALEAESRRAEVHLVSAA